jgi:hypothetical protein
MILIISLLSLENLSFAKGNLNQNVIERRSQSMKLLEELQTAVFKELLDDDFTRSGSKKYGKADHDLADAVKVIAKNRLLEDLEPRFHDSSNLNLLMTKCFVPDY